MTLALSPIGHELLDDPAADPAVVATSLRHIARANRWFGGAWAARWGMGRLLAQAPARPLTLLDVGTGSGDLPRDLARWAARRGRALRPLGLERSPVAARLAGAHMPAVVACAGQLPLAPRSVDLVLLSQVAHHLERGALVRLLRQLDAVARVGVVVADLRRSRLARHLFRLGSAALRFDAVTRADGLTSIARGFTPAALRGILAEAGIAGAVAARPGWRVVAWWRAGTAA